MQSINSEKDLLIVPTSYFEGLEKMLQDFVNEVEVHDMDSMEKLLHLRRFLKPNIANEEVHRCFPTIRWDNVHLLLPLQESCSHCSLKDFERTLKEAQKVQSEIGKSAFEI